MILPHDSTYTVTTEPTGYYSANIPGGIYEFTYEKDGYFPEFTEEQTLAENTIFPDITLLEHTSTINVPARFTTIQTAIDYALENDTVLVDTGTYTENLDYLGRNITIASKFLTTNDTSYIYQTILDGEQNGRIVKISNGSNNAVLNGFTMQNGSVNGSYPDGYGGAIFCSESNPNIKNLIIKNNSAEYGSAVYCENADPKLENLIIENNESYEDGTIYCSNSNPSLYNILSTNNSAKIGASICCWDSDPTLVNSTISHNQNSNGSTIFGYNSDISLYNTITSYNTGSYGIYIYSGSPTIEYCNFYNNENGNYYNCSPGTGCIEAAPLFADTANGDYRLTQDSPCIDAGTPDASGLNLPFFDLEGNVRIWDGDDDGIARIDMGAYEFDAPIYSVDEPELPEKITIYNYPNPAQNSTTIKYSLKQNSHVEISVYNIKGQLIKKLLDRPQNRGSHSLEFNTKELSTGVYFYK
ncbi:MAG: T9SS type A sorting domain-containing protein, partial [Candidatus Cloacimonetes bacterium]|nr:T9SS type A sorting domain-containing protein [Candidatus Cloacimonadota bacterium]